MTTSYGSLVMQTQMNYSRYCHVYASGGTPVALTAKMPEPALTFYNAKPSPQA